MSERSPYQFDLQKELDRIDRERRSWLAKREQTKERHLSNGWWFVI